MMKWQSLSSLESTDREANLLSCGSFPGDPYAMVLKLGCVQASPGEDFLLFNF